MNVYKKTTKITVIIMVIVVISIVYPLTSSAIGDIFGASRNFLNEGSTEVIQGMQQRGKYFARCIGSCV